MSRTSFAHLRAQLIHLAELAGFTHVIRQARTNVRARITRFRRSVRMFRLAPLDHLMQLPRQLAYYTLHVVALAALVLCMGGTWMVATDANATPGKSAAVTSPSASPGSSSTTPGTSATVRPITDDDLPRMRPAKKEVTGKININTATEAELMLLPTVGPSKAERVVTWRKKNGTFKRPADLRRVKGFGYKTFKRLEPFLDIKGDTTLAPRT